MPSRPTRMEAYVVGAWGILCAQFVYYTSLDKHNSMWTKLFVAGLALLTTLKSLHSLAMMWIQNVAMFGNLQAGSSPWCTHWLSKITVLVEAINTFYVQMFFCRRLWAISRNTYLVTVCTILFLAGLVSGVVTLQWHYGVGDRLEYVFTIGMDYEWRLLIHRSGSASGNHVVWRPCYDMQHNILLTLRLTSVPSGTRVNAAYPTAPATTILNSLRLSAVPAAVCALLNFAGMMWVPELVLLAFTMNIVLPHLYAWSAMWTLNSREEICLAAGNCLYTLSLGLSVGSSNSETTQSQHQGNFEPPAKEVGHLDSASGYLNGGLRVAAPVLSRDLIAWIKSPIIYHRNY
ncbi:hypothetical protein B0H14DRAFT_2631235 [Mycena olivaceomarginata]|nr:hypothetical protein B0H14DRAFT_2631235 [Mycena olivaceomarginata]